MKRGKILGLMAGIGMLFNFGASAANLNATASVNRGNEKHELPKYIFYFIGDGMGMSPVMATATYMRTIDNKDELPLMMQFPVAGQVMTWSASSPVTDSAAAGTALATGHKTKNGMLGMTGDTIAVESIAAKLQRLGYGVGIVTNVAADDATPGAFYAHAANRKEHEKIDSQFAESDVLFLAGAPLKGLVDKNGKATSALEKLRNAGVMQIHSLDSVRIAADMRSRVLLTAMNPFNNSNIGYRIDGLEAGLTLPNMTEAAIYYMKQVSPDRFFMMVEGGNIDHTLHGNDARTAMMEIERFNEALEIAVKFMEQHPDETLIVVTADHDTGGLSVGNEANGYTTHFEVLSHQKQSKEAFSYYCKELLSSGKIPSWHEMQQYLKEKFGFWAGVELSEEETKELADIYREVFVNKRGKDEKSLYSDFNQFSGAVFKLISQKAAIGWTTGAHSGNPVPVYSIGKWSEKFGKVLNNTEIVGKIAGKIMQQ